MKHHFDTLGLQEDASQEQIQEAYHRLSKELNPANNDNQEFFVEEYQKLQEAYKALNQSSILKNSDSSSGTVRSNRDATPGAPSSSAPSSSFTVTISPEKIEELKNKKIDNNDMAPKGLKTLCVLSMIGSGIMGLAFLFSLASFWNIFVAFSMFFMCLFFVLKFIGAYRMYNLKKNGYLMYTITSSIFIILIFLSLITGYQRDVITVSILLIFMSVFLYLFVGYKKHLK